MTSSRSLPLTLLELLVLHLEGAEFLDESHVFGSGCTADNAVDLDRHEMLRFRNERHLQFPLVYMEATKNITKKLGRKNSSKRKGVALIALWT